MTIYGNNYPKEYLAGIDDLLKNRMDTNKDGKVNIAESYKDLNVGALLSGLKEGSNEYNKLKALIDKVPQALQKYAGSDGVFQPKEWADFLTSNEWGEVIDTYHSSSNFAKLEMSWVDNSKGMIPDGQVTKGEVKAGLLNNLLKKELPLLDNQSISNKLEVIVDKYAGADGTFTVAEYTAMKNDPEYKQIIKDLKLVPFGESNSESFDSDVNFAKLLPTNPDAKVTVLQVGHGAQKINGYSAKNPETGKVVYADENGKLFTKEAFENWERLAKNGTIDS